MSDDLKLNKPWMVAVWPGMGNVGLTAGYYLMAKLGMRVLSEYSPGELFEVEHVEVKGGLIRIGRRPRSRFFAWTDPNEKRDIVVFIGEAQPPVGKYGFCQKLIEYARQLGVERVFTFAAMATQMDLEQEPRVFGAATDGEGLKELNGLGLEILEDGHIGGLNGVLLGVAAERKLPGTCLLGEMSHVLTHLPSPKGSLALLQIFTTIADVELDFTELSEQARAMEEKLGELLGTVEDTPGQQVPSEEEAYSPETAEEGQLTIEEKQRVEELFTRAEQDRSQAYELKRELDRLNVFKDYEDRFLDLFKESN